MKTRQRWIRFYFGTFGSLKIILEFYIRIGVYSEKIGSRVIHYGCHERHRAEPLLRLLNEDQNLNLISMDRDGYTLMSEREVS